MTSKEQKRFEGFSPQTFKFLRAIRTNNNKAWFQAHRSDYEQYILQPLRGLVVDLSDFMLDIDLCFEIAPVINKTISRIYRDTRFSRNKLLFKENMWIVFKRPSIDWKDDPGFFFEISANWYRYGMGFYSGRPDTMKKFREAIDENPKEVMKLISFYSKQRTFDVEGEKYKRMLDKTKPEKIQDWYQRKNLCLICTRKIDDRLFSRKLVGFLKSHFKIAIGLYNFLREVKQKRAPSVKLAGQIAPTAILPD